MALPTGTLNTLSVNVAADLRTAETALRLAAARLTLTPDSPLAAAVSAALDATIAASVEAAS
jgi:hypothetical protein